MKKRLLNYIFPILFLVGLLSVGEKAKAQIVVTSANTAGVNGVDSSPLISGGTGKVLFGFTLTNASASAVPINQFVLGATQSYIGNAYLYRSTAGSTSFTGSSSIQSLGSLGTYISINVSESIPALSSYTYFIVGDLNNIPGYVTLPTTIQFSFTSAIRSSPYTSFGSSFNGTNYTINNPTYTVTSVNTTGNGITASPVTPTQAGIVLFGFGISANATTTVSGFNLNSSSTQNYLSYYLGNGKLYRSNSSTFSLSTATQVTAATVSFSNYQHAPGVAISNISETITGTTVYYFVVADFNQTNGTLPATIQLSFQTSLSNSIVQSSPNSANIAVSSNITGLSFTFQNPTYTITGANASGNGITQGTLRPGQTGVCLYGFAASASSSTTVSEFHLYNTYNQGVAQAYFNNGKIYRSTSSTFSTSTATQITGATVSFGYDANSGIGITGLTESITTTPVYYFIVGDFYSGYYGALSATSQFSFKTSISNSIVQTSPLSSNITVGSNVDGTNFTLDIPTISVTGYNSTSNGISTGPLAYGQTGIVFFGFSVTVAGQYTISQIDIPATLNPNGYFTNGKLYRSTTPYFSNATQVSGASVAFTNNPTSITGLSESLSSFTGGTPTYYYFLVGDFTAGTSFSAPTSIQYNFANGTTSFYQASPYRTYNTPSTTNGTNFSIINAEKWTGATDNDFTKASNFQAMNGGSGVVPGTTMVVQIGTYTTAPNIAANTSIGGLSIVSGTSPTITIASGKVLTLNSVNNILSSASLTLSGGSVTIPSGTTTNLAASSTLNISGAAVSNAGTFNMASTSTLNLSGTSSVANTGTFTLLSDASGTARIGTLPSTASLTGTYVVQRYFTGGTLANRGYRLMSSPVQNGTTHVPAVNTDTYNFSSLKTNLLITGTGGSGAGFDQPSGYTANGPTILFYTPTSSTAGTFSSPSAPTATAKIASGFYFFFRGDNVTNLTTKVVKSGTYAVPESGVVGLQSGTLNQQAFNYTLAAVNGGYNLLGNPYPSSITLNSTALTAANTTQVVYTYTPGGTSITAHSVSGSNTWAVASGQGFFVKAPSGSSGGTVAFTESLKSSGQPTLLMGTPAATQEGDIVLQMVQDSSNYDYAELRFMDTYNKNYIETEDADDLNGSGQAVFFGAMTADNHLVAIASQPFEKKKTSVYLSVNDNTNGNFKINKTSLSNIPDKYDVWLVDHYAKDSLDLRAGSVYNFTIDKNNAATYGNSRMEVVIRTKTLPPYQLLTFTGKRNVNNNILNWTTKNEYTYTYFELQRSFDNKTFEGVNNSYSAGTGSYTFTDQSDKPVIYYRLKQTDINENVTYSAIVILKSDDANIFSVYPNPTDNTLHFALAQEIKSSVTLRVYNSMGTLMKIKTYTTTNGDQDVSNLTPGGYMAELIDDTTKKLIASAKFIKL